MLAGAETEELELAELAVMECVALGQLVDLEVVTRHDEEAEAREETALQHAGLSAPLPGACQGAGRGDHT